MRAGTLFAIGFALIIVGTVAVILGSVGSQNASTGIIIFIGPIPVVFGSGRNGGLLVLIGLVAAMVMILLFYLPLFTRRRLREEGERGAAATYK